MELQVSEIQELKPIDFNYLELKENLKEKLEVYKNTVYTEETIKEAKGDRAKLNKLSKAINDKKVEIKKEVLKPYEDFENKTKELIAMIGEATENIDTQIKVFEEKQKNEKLQVIVTFFEKSAEELKEMLNFDKIYNPKWLNTTYKITDIEAEIKHIITKSRQDLDVIKNLRTEFEDALIDYYFKTLNLTETMGEKTRLEEQKKKIEAINKQKELLNAEKDKTSGGTIQSKKNTQEIPFTQELQQLDFRVWVTQEQKFYLREFLVKNNIRYGKVK